MSGLPHTFPLLAGHAYPVRTARPILASLHASYIVECCHVDACCSTADVNSYKQPAPGHHVQRCKCNQPWSCACLYAHDQTRPSSSSLLQICKSARCNASVPTYKLNTHWCHAYAVDMTFFSKTIMMFDVFHYIHILEILWSSLSLIRKIYHLLF